MKISRRGSSADFGESTIEFACPEWVWDKSGRGLLIRQMRVKDFSTDSHHNYSVNLSMADLCSLIKAVSEAANQNKTDFEVGMESALKPLIRLQAIVSGIQSDS